MRRILIAVLALAVFAVGAAAQSHYSISFSQAVSSAVASSFISTTSVQSAPLQHFALQVSGKGAAATSWDVRLEGSLDGVGYSSLIQNSTADGDGSIKFSTTVPVNFAPVNYMRAYVKNVALGSATKITVTVLGTQ